MYVIPLELMEDNIGGHPAAFILNKFLISDFNGPLVDANKEIGRQKI